MQITVIGTGYVGIIQSVGLASMGHSVTAIDINHEKVISLTNGVLPVYEPGLEELFKSVQKKKAIKFTTSYDSCTHADIVFICVPTPQLNDNSADLTYVYSVLESMEKLPTFNTGILVIKSTVPVGTNKTIYDYISKRHPNIAVISNPEFLRQGSAVHDFLHPDRTILGGGDQQAIEQLKTLYAPISKNIQITTWESSELIKYAANSFLATKISFINELASLSELVGGDIEEIKKGIGSDHRIGEHFLHAGIGYGGSCFPKDIDALLVSGKQHQVHLSILDAAQKVNVLAQDRFINKILQLYEQQAIPKVIGILGLSFKANTDDVRSSVSIEIIKKLSFLGFTVFAYDPQAMKNVESLKLHALSTVSSVLELVKNVSIVAILTDWNEFALDENIELYNTQLNHMFDGKNLLYKNKLLTIGYTGVGV
jgi:UDPglucose 6-dehydrogenase